VLINHLPGDSAFIQAAAPDTALLARGRPVDEAIYELLDRFTIAHFKNVPRFARPIDQIKKRRQWERHYAALEAQGERIRRRRKGLKRGR
jgi:hypothetical protein